MASPATIAAGASTTASTRPNSAATATAGSQAGLAGNQPATAGVTAGPVAGAAGSDASTVGMAAAAGGAAGTLGASAGAAGAVDMATTSGACDHACLLAMMQTYIDALLAHDPSTLPVSTHLKYTENDETAELGTTVWNTATNLAADTRLDFADAQEGQVASQFVFDESGSGQVIYQVRLKVEAGEITEIESMAARNGDQFFNPAGMKTPAVFHEVPATPMSREDLKAITELYLDYLDGEKTGSELPFAEDCERTENGTNTASGRGAFEAQNWAGFFDVTRRILVIDEVQGITWGMFPFDKSDVPLVVGEAFKIMDGEIKMIQAVMRRQPSTAW